MKRLAYIIFILILIMSIIGIRNLVKDVWSEEANIISEEKKKILEERRKNKGQEIRKKEPAPEIAPAGPLTLETKELYKSSLNRRVEFIKNNIDKNDISISPTLEHLNLMLTPEEMLYMAPDIVEVLLEVVEKHRIAVVRSQALTQLRYLGDNSAIRRLKDLLNNEEDIAVRVYIVRTLICLNEEEGSLDILANVARKKEIDKWKVDTTSLWSGYSISQKEKALKKRKEVSIPNAALEGLAEIGTEEAKSVIREALNDENPFVRLTASRILLKFNEKSKVFPVIANIARDADMEDLARVSAIKFLGQMNEINIIESLLADENNYIRKEAEKVLQEKGK